MKKYNTSLKILFEDPVLFNEGFSRLNRVSFVAQKGAKCELDIPDEYRTLLMKYLTGFPKESNLRGAPDSGLDYTQRKIASDKKEKEDLQAKGEYKGGGVLDAIMKYTSTFFGAYATEMLNRENFQTLEELFNMFVMDSVPYVYCQALNRIMRMMLPVLKIYFEEIDTGDEEEEPATQEIDMDLTILTAQIYYEYGRKVLLPKVFRDAVRYTQKINSYDIKHFKKDKHMIYSILFFKNFSKEFLLNDKFDVDKLKEDILEFNDIYKLPAFKKAKKPTDLLDAFELFESAVEFDDPNVRTEADAIKKQIEGIPSDRNKAISFKSRLIGEYTAYLITIIEKVFYDPNFVGNITPECKNELDQFLNFLKTKLRN